MQALVAHILPLTTIRRERLLPIKGRIVVKMGQKVSPVDVIAEANLGYEHLLIDVARLLNLSAEEANSQIRVTTNERVEAGKIIAQRPGLGLKPVRAPRPGRVVAVGGGKVLLEVGEGLYELRAGLPGTVTRLIPERGVEITVSGAVVQGKWGNGRVDLGLMLSMLTAADDILTANRLDVSLRGSVVLGGHCEDANVLRAAGELPVRGLILGSISPNILQPAMQVRYPVLVIDGFGRRPMNAAAYKLLTTNNKRDVTVNGEPYDRYTGARPEIIIQLPVSQEPPLMRDLETLESGRVVRLCRAPNLGAVGMLVDLLPGLTMLPSGLRVPAAEVRLEDGKQIAVPLANLEVLG